MPNLKIKFLGSLMVMAYIWKLRQAEANGGVLNIVLILDNQVFKFLWSHKITVP
jgi:hypothetical protein